MMKALKNKLYSFLASGTSRFLFSLTMIFMLSGCENDDDTSLSGQGNYMGQAACWQAQIAKAVTMILDQLYNDSAHKVRDGGGNLMLVAFAVWLAFKLLKVLGSFKEESLGEVWTEIFQKLFMVAFCAVLIFNNWIDDAINVFVIPIFQTFIELGLRGMAADGGGTIVHVTAPFDLGDFGEINFTYDIQDKACPGALNMRIDGGALKQPIDEVSGCLICQINSRLNAGIKVGTGLVTSLTLFAMILGFLIMVLFTVAKFGFVLYLIDALFRLNFAAFLLPVLLMGVPFNYTRKWSKQGFLMFINSSGIMMFMAVLVNICIMTLEELLIKYAESSEEDGFSILSVLGLSTPLLAMLLVALLLVNLPGLAVTLADKFIGGGNGLEFQEKISKFIINSAKKVGAKVINTLTDGATNTATEMMEKYENTRAAIDRVKQVKSQVSSTLNSLAGYNDD